MKKTIAIVVLFAVFSFWVGYGNGLETIESKLVPAQLDEAHEWANEMSEIAEASR